MQMTSFDFFVFSINEYNFIFVVKIISYNFAEYIVYDVMSFKHVFNQRIMKKIEILLFKFFIQFAFRFSRLFLLLISNYFFKFKFHAIDERNQLTFESLVVYSLNIFFTKLNVNIVLTFEIANSHCETIEFS